MKAKQKQKSENKSKGQRIWRSVKRYLLFLFLAQLLYIVVLKWIDPPITLTQIGSIISGIVTNSTTTGSVTLTIGGDNTDTDYGGVITCRAAKFPRT